MICIPDSSTLSSAETVKDPGNEVLILRPIAIGHDSNALVLIDPTADEPFESPSAARSWTSLPGRLVRDSIE